MRLAGIAVRKGRPAAVAARVISRAELIREEMGTTLESWAEQEWDETLALVRSQLEEAAFAEAWEHGRKLTVDEAAAEILADA